MKPLLSIIVPTKNREVYLKSLIDIVCEFICDEIELIIQDNSDNNNDILDYIRSKGVSNIGYYYSGENLAVIENSSLAIKHSSGEYICFMGDDDLLSYRVLDFTKFMKNNGYDCASFKTSTYNWPGVSYMVHKFPNLVINNYKEEIYNTEPNDERCKLLRRGAVSLERMPQLYHGIVKRTCLDQIYEKTGTFFPGPSPDMAVAVALSYVVEKTLFTTLPIITSGKSPKSAAGLGTKHEHKGKLSEMDFLPKDIDKKWNRMLPKIWTGPTIYAQSCYEAINAMEKQADQSMFNYEYFYAFFSIFCSDNKLLLNNIKKKRSVKNVIKRGLYTYLIFLKRVKIYLGNLLLLKWHIGGELYDDIENSFAAERIIDSKIEKVNFEDLIRK